MGCFDTINCPTLHYFPFLSQPKKGSVRRVILNLSYTAGASINYRVTSKLLSGKPLGCPTVDDIIYQIRNTLLLNGVTSTTWILLWFLAGFMGAQDFR